MVAGPRGRVRPARDRRPQPRALREEPRRRARDGAAGRALAPADRGRRRGDVDPDLLEAIVFLESAGNPAARASDDLEGAVGLTQILAGTATTLLGMHVDVAASERLTRRMRKRGPTRAAAAQAAPGRRALRPAQGAGRRGALPDARPRALRPRRPGGGLVPHGDRQPRERAGRLRRQRRELGAGLLRRDAAQPPARVPAAVAASATTRPPTCGASTPPGRSCGCTARTPPSCAARRASRPPRRSAEEVLHPRVAHRRSSRPPDDLEDAYRAGELRPFARRRAGCALDPQAGRAGAPARRGPRLYRGLRPEAYELAVYLAAGVRHVVGHARAADRDQHRARPRLPAPARARQPVRHARVLAAHHRLRLRRAARLRERAPRRSPSSTCSTASSRST